MVKDGFVAAARELGPLVREHARMAEEERTLPRTLVDAFAKAGFFGMCRPASVGGGEADPLTVLRVIEEVAHADGSAGWCVNLNAACGFFAGLLPELGAREVFGDPGAAVGGVVNPTGGAVVEAGGYRLNGRWSFASTCKHAAWMGVSCLVFDGDSMRMHGEFPEVRVAFVPSSEYVVHDTWRASGLRGTGSHDIEASGVLVPEHRTFRMLPEAVHPSPLYRFPFFGFFAAANAAVALGVARAAIDELVKVAQTKTPFGEMSTLANRPTAQTTIGRAEGAMRSGRAYLHEATADLWARVQASAPITAKDRALYRIACNTATHNALDAVTAVFQAGGGSALYDKSPLQRCLRDAYAVTQHVSVAIPMFELAGATLVGVSPDHPLL
jgi:alkylation response protein AidB-like acyl-CoA dehydrogenase